MSVSYTHLDVYKRQGKYGGDTAISTVGIITSVQTLMLMPLIGMTQGQQPIISYNFGAKRVDRVKETLKYTIIASVSYTHLDVYKRQLVDSNSIEMYPCILENRK